MRTHWDIVIIGAGPAGMSAALEAVRHNLRVLVLDRQSEPGGQIFRNVGSSSFSKRSAIGKDYAKGHTLVASFMKAPVTYLPESFVWHLTKGRVYYSQHGKSHLVYAKQILIATGGMERPVPLPGWILPGVMGAGGADVLLKSASLLPKGPVILCGNGPLMLQIAYHLKHFSIPVAGALLTGNMLNLLKAVPFFPGALARPSYLWQGAEMGVRMLLGTPCYFGAKNLCITEKEGGLSVSFLSMGKKRCLEGTCVLLHDGVISESRITRLARLEHCWNEGQRYWHVTTDDWGKTSLDGMWCAGDVAGVCGADAALSRGKLAALGMCYALGVISVKMRNTAAKKIQKRLWRCEKMQPFMDKVFTPSRENLLPADDAIVCRCEELTAKELTKAICEGNYSPDGLKSQTRAGMGTCQGRMCSAAVAEMIAQVHNIPLDKLQPYHAQPPLTPLRLGELAAMNLPSEKNASR